MPRTPWAVAGLLILRRLLATARGRGGRASAGSRRLPPPILRQRFEQSFDQAVTLEVGPDQLVPPDQTVAGKSTAAMRVEIEPCGRRSRLPMRPGNQFRGW